MLNDLRHAVRLSRRNPAFTATVVLTLALGIGLTTTIFSVVQGVLLRPLPYSDPSALVTARSVTSESWLLWKDRTSALTDLAVYDFGRAPLLLAGEEIARVRQAAVSSNLLSVLGVQPVVGRDFQLRDTEPGAEPVALLTYGAWQRYFGGRADVVGMLAPFEPPRRIVGVLARDFIFPMRFYHSVGEVQILTPISMPPRPGYTFGMVARLQPAAGLSNVRTEELAMARGSAPAHPVRVGASATPLAEELVGGSRQSLLMLLGAAAFLLLIACANVGNLLFAKGAEGRRELGVRFALGASRTDLARLLIVQSCTLSVAGGILGILLAYASFDAMISLLPPQLPRARDISIDRHVLGFACVLSLISGATLGLFPAWHLSRGNIQSALRTHDWATLPAQRLRLVVLGIEVALAVILLSGAALFAHSLARLLAVDLGFTPENVLTLRVRTLPSRYPTTERQRAFLDQALERLASVPGVTNAAAVEMLPVTRARRGATIVALDRPAGDSVDAEPRVVSAGYFAAMGIDLLLGRSFARTDSSGAPQVAVINQTLADLLWPGSNPIGQRIRYDTTDVREVVGVVHDIRGYAVDTRPEPQVYVPYSQTSLVPERLVIRTSGAPEALSAAVRGALRAVDPRSGAQEIQPLTAHVATSIAQSQFHAYVLAIFAGSGLLLAAVGIAGIVAYATSRRTREIGIRIALGASGSHIVTTVAGPTMIAVCGGLSAGLAAALAFGRLARAFLFEIEPHDPLTLTVVVLVLGATGLGATWLPARRAQRIDPLVALRAE